MCVIAQPPDRPSMGGARPDAQTMVQMRLRLLTSKLGLTSDQQTLATKIFTNATAQSADVRSSLQTITQSLADAAKKNDTAAIDTLAASAGILSGQLAAFESKAEAAFYALLTADQRTQYDAMPIGGPGGPGGPGMEGGGTGSASDRDSR